MELERWHTDGKTYTVKVVSDSDNKYRFDDFGTSAVTLDLAEGGTYIVEIRSVLMLLPFNFIQQQIKLVREYTTGVTTVVKDLVVLYTNSCSCFCSYDLLSML